MGRDTAKLRESVHSFKFLLTEKVRTQSAHRLTCWLMSGWFWDAGWTNHFAMWLFSAPSLLPASGPVTANNPSFSQITDFQNGTHLTWVGVLLGALSCDLGRSIWIGLKSWPIVSFWILDTVSWVKPLDPWLTVPHCLQNKKVLHLGPWLLWMFLQMLLSTL